MQLEPRRHSRQVRVARAEASPEFGGREPLVIERRMRILLSGEKSIEVRLLRRSGVEQEQHAVEARRWIHDAQIEFRSRQWMDVASERDHPRFVDGVCDTRDR